MTSENNGDLTEIVVAEEIPEVTSIKVSEPRDGLPKIATTPAELLEIVAAISQGTGPVALDAERASGFKFSQRAYLIQLRREGCGSHLIDPTSFENLNVLQAALQDVDWILHAASQDLVCLAEVGLIPTAGLFDTELAGRLLGLPRVGLGPMIETQLGFALAKEHSAADWSTRPLPESWLNYAALDVEFLIEVGMFWINNLLLLENVSGLSKNSIMSAEPQFQLSEWIHGAELLACTLSAVHARLQLFVKFGKRVMKLRANKISPLGESFRIHTSSQLLIQA